MAQLIQKERMFLFISNIENHQNYLMRPNPQSGFPPTVNQTMLLLVLKFPICLRVRNMFIDFTPTTIQAGKLSMAT